MFWLNSCKKCKYILHVYRYEKTKIVMLIWNLWFILTFSPFNALIFLYLSFRFPIFSSLGSFRSLFHKKKLAPYSFVHRSLHDLTTLESLIYKRSRGEYLSTKIKNCLVCSVGYSETVWHGHSQPDNLKTVLLSFSSNGKKSIISPSSFTIYIPILPKLSATSKRLSNCLGCKTSGSSNCLICKCQPNSFYLPLYGSEKFLNVPCEGFKQYHQVIFSSL